jgi:magnesium transporter
MTVKDIEKVYDQSVTLSFFNQALIANVEVLNALKKGYFKFIPAKNKVLFEELYYDVLQIIDTEKIQREAITNLINVHSILTSTRLNEFMKRLTAIALIVAIPTMLSGIYGMNFRYIPFVSHRYGFYIVSGIMILITLGFYYLFKKFDWL